MKQWILCALLVTAPALAATASTATAPATAITPAAAAAPDLDITGTWTVTGDVQGTAVEETCHITQTDVVIGGDCDTSSGKQPVKGKIDGRTVTYTHAGNYQGTDYTATYTGKVAPDGSMTGTIDVDPFNVTGSFSAKKGDVATPPKA